MHNLIKNELIKIFYKRSTYVMFIILFLFVLFTNVLYKNKIDENGNFIVNSNIDIYLENTKEKLKDETNKEKELEYRKQIMKYELLKKYNEDSWQSYIINNYMIDIINVLVDNKYGLEKESELLLQIEKEYNLYLEKFDNDDWKYFVNMEINKTDNNIDLECLNYRLNNNISYSNTYLNTALNKYLEASKIIKTADLKELYEQDNLNLSRELVYNYYKNLSDMKVNKYILDNKINSNKVNDTRGILANLFVEYEQIIVIIFILITAGIVSNEFNKGTVKRLLVVPYKRNKILFSKYITSILMMLFTILLVIIMEFIIGTIIFGISSLNIPVVVYNFNISSIKEYNIFYYLLIETIAKLPMYILLITMIFLISIITLNNGISIIIGLLLYLINPIINSIIISSNLRLLNFTIFPHWDFNNYLFGMITSNYYTNINTSIIVSILYFILLIVPSYIIFNKKDIKNM